MNKYEEALDIINHYYVSNEAPKSLALMRELVKRATPIKPIEIEANHFICNACSNGIGVIGQRREWHKVFYPYCSQCGQCINWVDK